MKSAVVYYSFTGNTKQVALRLKECFAARGAVDLFELRDLKETGNFLIQCSRAFRRAVTLIEGGPGDLSSFDLLCIGTPVWAFGPAPAITTFLASVKGIAGKRAALFTTYGSGTGNTRCLNYMEQQLRSKGVSSARHFSLQQGNVKDGVFTDNVIHRALSDWI